MIQAGLSWGSLQAQTFRLNIQIWSDGQYFWIWILIYWILHFQAKIDIHPKQNWAKNLGQKIVWSNMNFGQKNLLVQIIFRNRLSRTCYWLVQDLFMACTWLVHKFSKSSSLLYKYYILAVLLHNLFVMLSGLPNLFPTSSGLVQD